MKALSYAVANVLGGVVQVMLLIDPTRPMLPVFVPPRFLPGR